MKHMKKFFAFLLAAVMIGSNIYLFSERAEAAGSILVFVNNARVDFGEVEPQIVNDRTMVPVRALADAIGASTNWNDEEKKVTLISGDRYAVLTIGNAYMSYGTLKTSAAGEREVATTEIFQLDSPPVIIDERSLFPTRAIADAFGADVNWVEDTQTVFITTYAPRPADMSSSSQATPAASSGPANSAFSDTTYFQEVSATRIETMHAGKAEKFAITIYDGQNAKAVAAMPMVKRAAEEAKWKVYGFDTTSSRFPNPENLKWVWDIVSKSSTDYPIIILSYEGQLDELLPSDISDSELVAKLKNLHETYPLLSMSASPSPSPTASNYDPWASPSPSPTSSAYASYQWNSLTPAKAEEKMWDSSDGFIYFIYDSYESGYNSYVRAVREAAQNVGAVVYYYDVTNAKSADMEWLSRYYSTSDPEPTILYIESRGIYDYISASTDVDRMETELEYYINRSLYKGS